LSYSTREIRRRGDHAAALAPGEQSDVSLMIDVLSGAGDGVLAAPPSVEPVVSSRSGTE
jgi:hypothetical protein